MTTRVVMLENIFSGGSLLAKTVAYDVADALAAELVTRKVARLDTQPAAGPSTAAMWGADGRSLIGPEGIKRPLMLTDPAGRPFDVDGRPLARLPYADVRGSTIWFPLNEGVSNKANDAVSGLIGSIQGGSSGPRWGQAPGLAFNGSNNRVLVTDGALGGFTHASKFICDLSTLAARGDMIVIWWMASHPATIPADCYVVGWGMNNDPAQKGGWAAGMKSTSGKMTFATRAKAGSSTVLTTMGTSGARGVNSDNTRTAMAMEIAASGVTGLLEVRVYQLTLGTDGGNSQSNVDTDTPAMVPNGTAIVDADVSNPLTLGAWADTSNSTFTGYFGSATSLMSLWNIGLQRRPYDPGIGMRICRNLRDASNVYAFPHHAR